jgi:hypothetical protein
MSAVIQKAVGIVASPISLVTTTETLVAYSGQVRCTFQSMRAFISGWVLVVYGATTTGVILRIRRGNGITGAVVAGGNTETAGVAAATVQGLNIKFSETIVNGEFADYSLTVQQVGATTAGTAQMGSIEAELTNG